MAHDGVGIAMKVTFVKKVITCGGCEIHLYRTEEYTSYFVLVYDPDGNLFILERVDPSTRSAAEATFNHHVIEQGGDRED